MPMASQDDSYMRYDTHKQCHSHATFTSYQLEQWLVFVTNDAFRRKNIYYLLSL